MLVVSWLAALSATFGDPDFALAAPSSTSPAAFTYTSSNPAVATISGDKAPALKVGDVIVRVDPRYFRPTEVDTLLGDPAKAKEKLGWTPQITVQEMCSEMVQSDLQHARKQSLLNRHGYAAAVSVE